MFAVESGDEFMSLINRNDQGLSMLSEFLIQNVCFPRVVISAHRFVLLEKLTYT
jgi:hypothetical protein